MKNTKRVLVACGIAIAAATTTLAAHATTYTVTGVPHLIYLQDHFYYSQRPDEVTLTGVTNATAPTCGVESLEGGSNLIGITVSTYTLHDRIWQLIIAAKQAGTPITMKISDTQLDGAKHCHLVAVYAM